jgi:enoyl-CoA hydratase/carnithine racemase
MTGIPTLIRLVGLDVAKELTYTARRISGREAFELGLATHVSEDPRADAFALAHEIAGRNPDAIRAAKALLEAASERTRAESFLEESRLMGQLMGSPNQIEAVMSEMERRAPNFGDATN